MEDFPLLFLFLIVYLFSAASSSKKKKQKKRRQTMRASSEGEQMDWRRMIRDRQAAKGFGEAFEEAEHEDVQQHDCHQQPVHLHTVSQMEMEQAAEGEDPCHAGGRTNPSAQEGGEPKEALDDTLRQDVLRGVIMSEILTRPHERRAIQRNRQGYHG